MIGIGICLLAALCTSCRRELIEYGQGDLRISIEKGDAYLHDFPLFLGISKKNAPQMAVWAEDMHGNFLSTIYATRKIATQSWTAAGGNRRKEALPCWCHARGVRYDDGLYLPTKAEPLTDGVSGATPREDFEVKITPKEGLKRFVIKIEINHSTDLSRIGPRRRYQLLGRQNGQRPARGRLCRYGRSLFGTTRIPGGTHRAQQPRRKRRVCRSGPLDAHLGITHRQGDRHPHPAMKKLLHLLFSAGLSCYPASSSEQSGISPGQAACPHLSWETTLGTAAALDHPAKLRPT